MIDSDFEFEVGTEVVDQNGENWICGGFAGDTVWLVSVDSNAVTEVVSLRILVAEYRLKDVYDITNMAMCCSRGLTEFGIINVSFVQSMTREQALVTAGWLVAMADPLQRDFPHILQQICNN